MSEYSLTQDAYARVSAKAAISIPTSCRRRRTRWPDCSPRRSRGRAYGRASSTGNVQPPADRSRAMVIQPRTLELFDDSAIVGRHLPQALRRRHHHLLARRNARARFLPRRGAVDSPYPDSSPFPRTRPSAYSAVSSHAPASRRAAASHSNRTMTPATRRRFALHADGTRESVRARVARRAATARTARFARSPVSRSRE